jgi:ABC-type transporter Mla subunit MlaD
MTLALILQGVLALLLTAVLAGGWVLHRKLDVVRGAQRDMATLATRLAEATGQAQAALFQLRAAAKQADDALAGRVELARALADELAIVTQAGERVSHRIEAGLSAKPVVVEPVRTPAKSVTSSDSALAKLRGVR